LIDELKNHELNLKVERNVNEYLNFFIEESKDKRKLTMIQPHALTCLSQSFGDEIKGKRKFLTPGMLRIKMQKSTINMDILDAHYQKIYRFRVGMLLSLTKYSCPDICNIF
jgi:hypothetical protein